MSEEQVVLHCSPTLTGIKRVGTWKVYGDEKAAQKRFDEFAACTRSCVKRFREGATLRELTGSRQAM